MKFHGMLLVGHNLGNSRLDFGGKHYLDPGLVGSAIVRKYPRLNKIKAAFAEVCALRLLLVSSMF